MPNNLYDIAIVGGGPAGMTAALYARRSDKKVIIFEKENFGGQMALAPKVENFPSIKSSSGQGIAEQMFDQIMELGVEFELEEVEAIQKNDNIFTITTNYHEYKALSVIVASGAAHRHIGIPHEEDWIGKGLSYCAVCDGAFYKNEEVAVVGDGNSALQYALDLSGYCSKVYVCTLFDKFFGDQVLVNRLSEKDNIEIIHNISLRNIHGQNRLECLEFENTLNHQRFDLKVTGVFIAIGQVPNNNMIKNLANIDKDGYVISDELLNTNTDGLFVAGDCRTKAVRQVTTAVADGAVAAIRAINYLNQ